MKIAIDLNDVIRAYSKTFAKYYKKEKNESLDIDNIELFSNDLSDVFEFNNKEEYHKFLYEDYPYEIFGSCPPVEKDLPSNITNWLTNVIDNIEIDDEIEFMIVSPMEYALTIQSTYFFLSKIGCRIREVYLPKDSSTIWDKCDVLISANPKLLNLKPDNKISIKINMPYNNNCQSDFSYESMNDFILDENNVYKLLNKNDDNL